MNEWISIKNELPSEDSAYWVYDGSLPEVERMALIGMYINGAFHLYCPCEFHSEFCFNKKLNVTHWLPLPNPPAENNG